MTQRRAAYWASTGFAAFALGATGLADLLREALHDDRHAQQICESRRAKRECREPRACPVRRFPLCHVVTPLYQDEFATPVPFAREEAACLNRCFTAVSTSAIATCDRLS